MIPSTPRNNTSSTDVSRKAHLRRGSLYRLRLRQAVARYLVYFALPVTGMLATGLALDGARRAITWLALLALLPALLMLSTWHREPIGPWVAQRVRRREVAFLERLWASSPHTQP